MSTVHANHQFVLATRPKGLPTAADFKLTDAPIPEPKEGQLLLKVLYLSLDPYMRGRMSDAASYAAPLNIGDVITGESVCRVKASQHPNFKVGDLVTAFTGWQEYAAVKGDNVTLISAKVPKLTYALGAFGMPGFTAYEGLLTIGMPKPDETVAVAAATGAVGSLVGQIAKIKGCNVVGIAGGPQKCNFAIQELGFDACIDHHDANFATLLKEACPKGIDVYFENVGGAVLLAILPLLNNFARIPVCGLIAYYNLQGIPNSPDHSPQLLFAILTKRLKVQGFINGDFREQYFDAFINDMLAWHNAGEIKYREDIVSGFTNAPEAFIGLLQGKNFGKLIVEVAKE